MITGAHSLLLKIQALDFSRLRILKKAESRNFINDPFVRVLLARRKHNKGYLTPEDRRELNLLRTRRYSATARVRALDREIEALRQEMRAAESRAQLPAAPADSNPFDL